MKVKRERNKFEIKAKEIRKTTTKRLWKLRGIIFGVIAATFGLMILLPFYAEEGKNAWICLVGMIVIPFERVIYQKLRDRIIDWNNDQMYIVEELAIQDELNVSK